LRAKYAKEIASTLERAEESIPAAKQLIAGGYFDFAASRAYYAAFYAASAALLSQGFEYRKHSGVIAAVHQALVKTGKVDTKFGKDLNWLFELRGIGDYGITVHVSREDAERAIEVAEAFLLAMKRLIKSG